MDFEQEKTTALYPPVGADGGQPLSKETNQSIAEDTAEYKTQADDLEEIMQQIRRASDPAYLPTVSMNDLYEQVFPGRPPVIDGLLYAGTYLFVGAPKVGKSFLMAQLAYHVSMGIPLWGYAVNRGTVLYLALEDDHRRLQDRLYRMFGENSTENLYFAVYAKQLNKGLETQLKGFIREHPDTRLIIIDTLQKIREDGGEKCSYASDYEMMASLKGNRLVKGRIKEVDYFLWREGLLCFNDISVRDMIEKLKLYYGVDIVVNNTRILKNRYTGKFRTKDGVEHVLKVLKLNNKFTYTKNDETNVITIN